MARILIVGKGGYGDMFPMFAIANALKSKGHLVSIAAEGHHEDATSSINIPLIKLDPPNISNATATIPSIFAKFRRVTELLQPLTPMNLEAEYETLAAVAQNNDLIIGNHFAYSGSIVSKKLEKPWVYCTPIPLAISSYKDPSLFPYLHRLQNLSMAYPIAQRPYVALARGISRLLMYPVIVQQRRLGIKNDGHPRFEGIYSKRLNLLMTSPTLVSPQADWPENTVVTGFTWFEPDFMNDEEKSRNLSRFMASGPPPVIFAAGGSKRTRPGQFFAESIKACRLLGIRAVLVAAKRFHAELPHSPNTLITGYLPYSALLSTASAIIHSGGIGTIGWSLRFAVPSLLVPSSWDHYDNARRASQRKLAMVMNQENYKAAKIASILGKLLGNQEQHQLLQSHSKLMAAEDGARVACAKIESVLERITA